MESKKLNFDKPLLSTRRRYYSPKKKPTMIIEIENGASIMPSQLKSGPVGSPGAVPFLWEQIPGRPKTTSQCSSFMNCPQLDQCISIRAQPEEESKSWDSQDSTLSRMQPFSFNCSLSCLIGMDDLPSKNGTLFSDFLQIAEEKEVQKSDTDTACGLLPRFLLTSSSAGLVHPVAAIIKDARIRAAPSSRNKTRGASYERKIIEKANVMDTDSHMSVEDNTQETNRRSFGCPEKGYKTFRELLADIDPDEENSSTTCVVEKTIEASGSDDVLISSKTMDLTGSDTHESDRKCTMLNSSVLKQYLGRGKEAAMIGTSMGNFRVPLPPPLPKSPSDSWLWRTLPSLSRRDASRLRSYLAAADNPRARG